MNAATAALVNAGSVPMRGVVCAAAVGRMAPVDRKASLVLDPEEAELPRLTGGGCFAFMFSSLLGEGDGAAVDAPACSLLWTNYTTAAPFDVEELAQARELATAGARQVWSALRESVGLMGSSRVFVAQEVKEGPLSQPTSGTMDVDEEKVEI